MSDAPERPPRTALLEALAIRTHAKRGLAVGVAVAALAYAVRVGELLGPTAATNGSPLLFLALAFVLAATTGALVTTLLVARSAARLAGESADGAE